MRPWIPLLFLLFCGAHGAKYVFSMNTTWPEKCDADGFTESTSTNKEQPLKLLGVRLIAVQKDGAEKGKIVLSIPIKTATKNQKLNKVENKNVIQAAIEITSDATNDPILKDLNDNGPKSTKYDLQVYIFIEETTQRTPTHFGAPAELYGARKPVAPQATDNPYYNSPIRFETIKAAINKKVLYEFRSTAKCGMETTSNWLSQAGIYKLQPCDGAGCGTKNSIKTAGDYMWKKVYFDPYFGYVPV